MSILAKLSITKLNIAGEAFELNLDFLLRFITSVIQMLAVCQAIVTSMITRRQHHL